MCSLEGRLIFGLVSWSRLMMMVPGATPNKLQLIKSPRPNLVPWWMNHEPLGPSNPYRANSDVMWRRSVNVPAVTGAVTTAVTTVVTWTDRWSGGSGTTVGSHTARLIAAVSYRCPARKKIRGSGISSRCISGADSQWQSRLDLRLHTQQ